MPAEDSPPFPGPVLSFWLGPGGELPGWGLGHLWENPVWFLLILLEREWLEVGGLAHSRQEQELGLQSHLSGVRQGWLGLAWQETRWVGWASWGGEPGAQNLISSTDHRAAPDQSAFRN